MDGNTDPWNWDVNAVVYHLCKSRRLLESRPHSVLPDPARFEQALRTHSVNGATLLVSVDKAALKEDFGVRSLGEISAVLYVIYELRRHSPRYAQHRLVEPDTWTAVEETTPVRPLFPPPSSSMSSPPSQPPQAYTTPARLRSNEHLVEDSSGRKRRRLNLSEHTAIPGDASETPILHKIRPAPRHMTSPEHADLISLPSLSQLTPGYRTHVGLGLQKLLADDIFYGSTRMGNEVNTDLDMQPLAEEDAQGESEIMYLNTLHIPGRQTYVYRLMQHFMFRGEPVDIRYRGRTARALFPYRSDLSPPNLPRSFTLVDMSENATKLLKCSDGDYEVDIPAWEAAPSEWDFANHWAKQESTLLPKYGASESGSEMDESLANEISADEEEDRIHQESKNLGKAAVHEVVENAINGFINRWRAKKLPIRESTAFATWRKGSNQVSRHKLARLAEAQIACLNRRISRAREDIEAMVWTNAADLERQCASLEESVLQREEQAFKARLWLQSNAPPRGATPLSTRRKNPTVFRDGDDDGIVLSSENELDSDGAHDLLEMDLDHGAQETAAPKQQAPLKEEETSADASSEHPPDASDPAAGSEADQSLGAQSDGKGIGQHSKKQSLDIIDLTQMSSDVEMSPMRTSETPFSQRQVVKADAEAASGDAIRSWSWEQLEARQDRKALILKLLKSLPASEFAEMRGYSAEAQGKIKRDVMLGLKVLAKKNAKAKIPGFTPADSKMVLRYTRLWICWFHCVHHYFPDGPLPFQKAVEAFESCEQDDFNLSAFISVVRRMFNRDEEPTHEDQRGWDNFVGPSATPHKKRKRDVAESQQTLRMREKRKKNLQAREERSHLHPNSSFVDADDVSVNPGRGEDEAIIVMNRQIAARIRPHQIEGVRFLWGEIVAATKEESDSQGCLLSHTMGLGKTMQAITLLVTIAEASNSRQLGVRNQIPTSLRQSRSLVLAPSALVLNWIEEFDLWIPADAKGVVGPVWNFNEDGADRLETLALWHSDGGILVVSYDLFHRYINNTVKPPLDDERHASVKSQLLNGPNLIIADEAHKLKNAQSAIAKAAGQLRSRSRVALTGSPLSNSLSEYYEMINWVAPGYLGERIEFKANFEEPIKEGGYVDSTSYERRRAIQKLKVLEEELDPKVHRRDVTVLKGSLKAKTEFVLTFPLTEVQTKMYKLYLESLEVNGAFSNTRLFDWLNSLALICNHPMAFIEGFRAKIADKERSKQKLRQQRANEDNLVELDAAADVDADSGEQEIEIEQPIALMKEQLKAQERIFDELKRSFHSKHSARTRALMRILRHAEATGDAVLVFSQSIPTLNYLDMALKRNEKRYIRLDGTTSMAKRKDLVKDFNAGKYNVFLISTRAGGLGINIPGANRVVIFDFSFNPQWEEQAIGRAYRIGQDKPVFVYRFVAGGTFEEKLFNQTIFKRQLAFKVVEKAKIKNLAQRRMDYLFQPKDVAQEDLEGNRGKDEVLDKILDEFATGKESCYVRKIVTSEVLKVAAEDEALTAEEEREVQAEVAERNLKKTNPTAWNAMRDSLRDTASGLNTLRTPAAAVTAQPSDANNKNLAMGASSSSSAFRMSHMSRTDTSFTPVSSIVEGNGPRKSGPTGAFGGSSLSKLAPRDSGRTNRELSDASSRDSNVLSLAKELGAKGYSPPHTKKLPSNYSQDSYTGNTTLALAQAKTQNENGSSVGTTGFSSDPAGASNGSTIQGSQAKASRAQSVPSPPVGTQNSQDSQRTTSMPPIDNPVAA